MEMMHNFHGLTLVCQTSIRWNLLKQTSKLCSFFQGFRENIFIFHSTYAQFEHSVHTKNTLCFHSMSPAVEKDLDVATITVHNSACGAGCFGNTQEIRLISQKQEVM